MLAKCSTYIVVFAGVLFAVSAATAQPLGQFRWQMTPACNVLTLSVTQNGSVYRLEGYDDQCGTTTRASVVGLAVPNTDGTLEFGLTIVSATGATPSHVDVTLNTATLGGPWRDSSGNSGDLVFAPTSVSGSPRVAGIGALAIDSAQVQRRVSGACASGQYVSSVNEDGTVLCGTDVSGVGTITGVTAGTGLTGGGSSGAVSLALNFAGTGTASTAARSNHTHAAADPFSTAVGTSALLAVTTGTNNTAIGNGALRLATTGGFNTAVGAAALRSNITECCNVAAGFAALQNTTAGFNTAMGYNAMLLSSSGGGNAAFGSDALHDNTTGVYNVAIGASALFKANGSNNIALGALAGDDLLTGSNNLYLGIDGGLATESNATYIRGVSGATSASGVAVYVNAAGKLGTLTSSIRFKEDVNPIGDISRVVQALKPVSFYYKSEFGDSARVKQYGLIAEDVAEVLPDFVVRDADGAAQTVRYHFLTPLLLAEVQRLEGERKAQDARLAELAAEIANLRRLLTTSR
jgi:hypothetical protein